MVRIDRRHFMQHAAALGALSGAGSQFWTGLRAAETKLKKEQKSLGHGKIIPMAEVARVNLVRSLFFFLRDSASPREILKEKNANQAKKRSQGRPFPGSGNIDL